MELIDLKREEKVVFVALLKNMVLADRKASESEIVQIEEIVELFGEDLYHDLVAEADAKWSDEESTKTFISTVENQESRDLIYGTVLEIAFSDGIDKGEMKLLDWLEKAWNIKVEYVE
jgi:uncharacterized tellurite resistance protein B-like protein